MSTETTVLYIVTYIDPDRPVDGEAKTRHFMIESDAREFCADLPTRAPNARHIKLTRRVTTIKEEVLLRA